MGMGIEMKSGLELESTYLGLKPELKLESSGQERVQGVTGLTGQYGLRTAWRGGCRKATRCRRTGERATAAPPARTCPLGSSSAHPYQQATVNGLRRHR